MLDVPGATLHYKVQGEGPLLLVLQAGDADADASDALAGRLADTWRVVTYDRRGLARSPLDDPSRVPDVATHSDDAFRLLAHLTDEPASVLGVSIGALIGLDLLARHPERVRRLVAHEPPVFDLLPADERAAVFAGQQRIEELFRSGGPAAAMRAFVATTGFDPTDREPDIDLPSARPERAANMAFFLTHDAPAVRAYHMDLPALQTVKDRVVPAVGVSSRSEAGAERCARELAATLDVAVAVFPGGHSGFVLRPTAFAARLREVLE